MTESVDGKRCGTCVNWHRYITVVWPDRSPESQGDCLKRIGDTPQRPFVAYAADAAGCMFHDDMPTTCPHVRRASTRSP